MDVDKLNKYLAPVMERPQLKKWLILQLERRKHKDGALFFPELPDKQYVREPVEFREALKEALRPLFKTVVYTKFHDGALWAAIDMLSIGLQHPKITIFLVHYPHAEFVFVSRIKSRSVQLSLHEALCDVFQCEQVRVVNCKGRDLTSLKDMALHPLSQGSFGAYRLYTALLDSNLFDDEDEHLDRRRRNRAMDRADERAKKHGTTSIVSPSKARRFELTGGLGAVVDESRARKDSAAVSSGALTRDQRDMLSAGTSAVNEIRLVVDHDLEWANKKIPFSCTVIVRGSNIIRGMSKLGEKGLVDDPSRSVSDVVADASNVIKDAFEARDRKSKKLKGAHAAGSENDARKMVRTIAVQCV